MFRCDAVDSKGSDGLGFGMWDRGRGVYIYIASARPQEEVLLFPDLDLLTVRQCIVCDHGDITQKVAPGIIKLAERRAHTIIVFKIIAIIIQKSPYCGGDQ